MSDPKELISEAMALCDGIYNADCYAKYDLLRYQIVLKKLEEQGVEVTEIKTLKFNLPEERVEATEPVVCLSCHGVPRRVEDGIVVSSDRTVYRLCEDDIIGVAEQRGVKLTEDQLDEVARYVEKGYDPDGNWEMVIKMALDEVGG